jgi:hypothetical protein
MRPPAVEHNAATTTADAAAAPALAVPAQNVAIHGSEVCGSRRTPRPPCPGADMEVLAQMGEVPAQTRLGPSMHMHICLHDYMLQRAASRSGGGGVARPARSALFRWVLTGCGSTRRRSIRPRRSTRTSEPGTLRELRTWPAYALIAVACTGGVQAAALMHVGLAYTVSGTRCSFVLCRTHQRSRIGRHLCAALSGLGACSCRARTRWYCVRGWHALCDMLRCCCSSAYQLTGVAWDAVLLGPYKPDRA